MKRQNLKKFPLNSEKHLFYMFNLLIIFYSNYTSTYSFYFSNYIQ